MVRSAREGSNLLGNACLRLPLQGRRDLRSFFPEVPAGSHSCSCTPCACHSFVQLSEAYVCSRCSMSIVPAPCGCQATREGHGRRQPTTLHCTAWAPSSLGRAQAQILNSFFCVVPCVACMHEPPDLCVCACCMQCWPLGGARRLCGVDKALCSACAGHKATSPAFSAGQIDLCDLPHVFTRCSKMRTHQRWSMDGRHSGGTDRCDALVQPLEAEGL